MLQQCLPLAVLKHEWFIFKFRYLICEVATVLTACGIETSRSLDLVRHGLAFRCNSTYRLRYWNYCLAKMVSSSPFKLQQCLPLVVCDEGGEIAEKRRWGPHISSPWLEGRENKKIEWMCLLLVVLKRFCFLPQYFHFLVATALTTYSMYQLNSINPRVNHFDLLGGFVS